VRGGVGRGAGGAGGGGGEGGGENVVAGGVAGLAVDARLDFVLVFLDPGFVFLVEVDALGLGSVPVAACSCAIQGWGSGMTKAR